jgi:NCS1 family nucleobase:cation symporter-1
MPQLITQLARRIEVNRDIDTNVNAYVNKDTRPLPPSRRTYGPWSFVGLWMVSSFQTNNYESKCS